MPTAPRPTRRQLEAELERLGDELASLRLDCEYLDFRATLIGAAFVDLPTAELKVCLIETALAAYGRPA